MESTSSDDENMPVDSETGVNDANSDTGYTKKSAFLFVVTAVGLGLLVSVFVFPIISPPAEQPEYEVGAITLDPTEQGLVITAEGTFPKDAYVVEINGEMFGYMDVRGDNVYEQAVLTELEVGDTVAVVDSNEETGERSIIDQYEVDEDSPWL